MYYDYEQPMLTTQQLTESLTEHIKESARREQELFSQMSKWSNLYNEIQNQLYDEDRLVKDSITDFAPVGSEIRWQDGSLNDLGKRTTLLGIKGLMPAIDEFVQFIDSEYRDIKIYNETEVFQKLDKSSVLDILHIGGTDSSIKDYKHIFPNANIDQLNVNTFEQTNKVYDLVVSYGQNTFSADLNILNFALKHTKKECGIIILKNVCNINLWQIILKMLICKKYQAQLIDSNGIALVICL